MLRGLSCIWGVELETCIILSARRYEFKDDKTGELVKGCSVDYVTGDLANTETQRGAFPLTITAPPDVFGQLQAVPGAYEMDFKQRPGRNGRPTLQLVGLRFKQSLEALFKPVQVATEGAK